MRAFLDLGTPDKLKAEKMRPIEWYVSCMPLMNSLRREARLQTDFDGCDADDER